jgi:hypothetical protein
VDRVRADTVPALGFVCYGTAVQYYVSEPIAGRIYNYRSLCNIPHLLKSHLFCPILLYKNSFRTTKLIFLS